MRSKNAFTLVEMLAVVGIMLVLMSVAFGVFSLFAERSSPEAAAAIIQAVLNNARDYAASNGVRTGIFFYAYEPDRANPFQAQSTQLESTIIRMMRWPADRDGFEDIPGRIPVRLPERVYILKNLPTRGPGAAPPVKDPKSMTPEDMVKWRQYEQDILAAIQQHEALSGGDVDSEVFYLEFGPAGYPPATPRNPRKVIQNGLTIVKLAGPRVTAYAFYPLNTNTGTRLIFE